jgi:formate-dependent nitrite reductase membrane component NrfD
VATQELLPQPDSENAFQNITPALELVRTKDPRRGYEDVPILKRPVWGWEIAVYFFVEGVSAGMYALGTIADLVGLERHRNTIAYGRLTALFAMMPAPGLLIADLGRPERFHHMLRVFKPRSPMNLGSWALTSYALFTSIRALHGFSHRFPRIPLLHNLLKLVPERLASVAGLPSALTMLSYPGVLLESTSIPVWAHTPYLGPLIAASSVGSAAAAISLIAESTHDALAIRQVERVENASVVAEGACLGAYLASARGAAKPLVSGGQSKLFWVGAVTLGMVAPLLLRRRESRAARIAGSLLTLAGSFALKWTITHAGPESASDRQLADKNAKLGGWAG